MKDYTNTSKKNIISALRDKGVDVNDDVEWYELDDKIEQIKNATEPYIKDWNQNDSTAADYIKNRPFYTGDPVETVLVEESTVPFAEQEGLYVAQFRSNFVPIGGEVYKVSWDGTVYECTCIDFNRQLVIGNLSIAGVGSDTGEPFMMAIFSGARMNIGTLDTSASHIISISGFVAEVVKIDEKYLPDDLTSKISTLSGDVSELSGDVNTLSRDVNTLSNNVSIKIDKTNPTGSGSFSLNRKANTTIGANSFAEGDRTTASGQYSHAEGFGTIASSNYQHVQGKHNIEDSSGTYADIVGNGDVNGRSNAYTLDWSGNAWYSGTIEGRALILPSSTKGSTKKFKITVDDSGTITATEVV